MRAPPPPPQDRGRSTVARRPSPAGPAAPPAAADGPARVVARLRCLRHRCRALVAHLPGTHGPPAAVFLFRSKIGLRRPAVRRRSSSTPPRTKLLLRPPGCSDVARDTLAGVAASSGGGATHCRSSSSWCPIRLHASCRSRADTATDVAEGRPRALFSCLVYHRHPPLTVLLLSSAKSC